MEILDVESGFDNTCVDIIDHFRLRHLISYHLHSFLPAVLRSPSINIQPFSPPFLPPSPSNTSEDPMKSGPIQPFFPLSFSRVLLAKVSSSMNSLFVRKRNSFQLYFIFSGLLSQGNRERKERKKRNFPPSTCQCWLLLINRWGSPV